MTSYELFVAVFAVSFSIKFVFVFPLHVVSHISTYFSELSSYTIICIYRSMTMDLATDTFSSKFYFFDSFIEFVKTCVLRQSVMSHVTTTRSSLHSLLFSSFTLHLLIQYIGLISVLFFPFLLRKPLEFFQVPKVDQGHSQGRRGATVVVANPSH